ncbi:AAA family ATPase [Pyrobaculum sp.]|uniref:AAA family ATPase n=1 Tax=Pyrobaculum sp. TaxID=2004705 RepID=UPI003D13C738
MVKVAKIVNDLGEVLEVEIQIGRKVAKISGNKAVLFGPNGGGKSSILKAISKSYSESVYVDICKVYRNGVEQIDVCQEDVAFDDPEVADRLTLILTRFDGTWRIYYDKALRGGKWVKIARLSFGERRLLALAYAVQFFDKYTVLLIEAVEAGLSPAWLQVLFDYLTELKPVVMAEGHSEDTLRLARERGWRIYYVDKTDVREVEDLAKALA